MPEQDHEGSERPLQPVMDEASFGERMKEVLESITETRQPALVTRGGKLAAIIVPYTMKDVAENLLLDPEVRRSLDEADRALIEGRTQPASEAEALADDPQSLENVSLRRENISSHRYPPGELPPMRDT